MMKYINDVGMWQTLSRYPSGAAWWSLLALEKGKQRKRHDKMKLFSKWMEKQEEEKEKGEKTRETPTQESTTFYRIGFHWFFVFFSRNLFDFSFIFVSYLHSVLITPRSEHLKGYYIWFCLDLWAFGYSFLAFRHSLVCTASSSPGSPFKTCVQSKNSNIKFGVI